MDWWAVICGAVGMGAALYGMYKIGHAEGYALGQKMGAKDSATAYERGKIDASLEILGEWVREVKGRIERTPAKGGEV